VAQDPDPFDPDNNPDGLDIQITYAYDGPGNQIQITDDNDNTTFYVYDGANRLRRELYADGTDVSFEHDGVGNVILRTDQMDNETHYEYDDLHRLTTRTYQDGRADTFTYDRASQMLTADNEHSHIGYEYDDVGRITSSTQTDLPQTYSYSVGYDYEIDPNLPVNRRTLTYPSGKIVDEYRDVRNRLAEVWQDGVLTAWYEYEDPGDRVLVKAFENGTEARYAYNDNDWITELRHVAPDGMTTFAGFAHDYDAVGNRLNAENLQDVIPYDDEKPVTHSEVYEYDDIYRLVDYRRGEWVGGDIPDPRRHRTWQIDGVHNWEQFSIVDLDTGEDATYCNQINQMNEYDDPSNDDPPPIPDDDGLPDDFMVSPCDGPPFLGPKTAKPRWSSQQQQPDPDTGFNHAHDKNGNLVHRSNLDDTEIWEYFYDYDHRPIGDATLRAENRLTMVKHNGTTVGDYWYDALGRCIRETRSGDPVEITVIVYRYDWQPIEEYVNDMLTRKYSYGGLLDEIITMNHVAADDRLYYHTDVHGSVVAVTDNVGETSERYVYDAYGTPSIFDPDGLPINTSQFGNRKLYVARRYDESSGLYYHRARWFDPLSGRYDTRDPIRVWHDLVNSGNGYCYVRNNPIVNSDPTGMDTWVGEGVSAGGFLFFAGFSSWTGIVCNLNTGECCKIITRCIQVGGGLGGSIGLEAQVSFGGPHTGPELAGSSISAFASASAPGLGALGGNWAAAEGTGGLSHTGGVSEGLKLAGGGQYCWTEVEVCWKPTRLPEWTESVEDGSGDGGGGNQGRPPVKTVPTCCCFNFCLDKETDVIRFRRDFTRAIGRGFGRFIGQVPGSPYLSCSTVCKDAGYDTGYAGLCSYEGVRGHIKGLVYAGKIRK